MSAVLTPIRFAASSYVLRVDIGGSPEDLTLNVTAGRDYWNADDGTADSSAGNGDLFELLETMLETHSSAPTVSVDLTTGGNDRQVCRVQSDQDIELLWSHANTTLDPTIFGFEASDVGPSAEVTSPNPVQGIWLPDAEFGPDSRDRITTLRGRSEAMDGTVYTSDFGESADKRTLSWTLLDQSVILEEYATEYTDAFELYWRDSISRGRRLRIYASTTDLGGSSFDTYVNGNLDNPMERNGEYAVRWDVTLDLVGSA